MITSEVTSFPYSFSTLPRQGLMGMNSFESDEGFAWGWSAYMTTFKIRAPSTNSKSDLLAKLSHPPSLVLSLKLTIVLFSVDRPMLDLFG